MRIVIGLLLIVGALVYGAWWWRRNYEPSPLETHLADLKIRSDIGAVVTRQHYNSRPTFTTVGSGIFTATLVNPNNPASWAYNKPGKLQLYVRAPVQP